MIELCSLEYKDDNDEINKETGYYSNKNNVNKSTKNSINNAKKYNNSLSPNPTNKSLRNKHRNRKKYFNSIHQSSNISKKNIITINHIIQSRINK